MSAASSKAAAKTERWPAWRGLIVIAVVLLGYVISSIFGALGQAAVYFIAGRPAGFEDSTAGQFTFMAFTYGFFVLFVALIMRKLGVGRRDIGLTRPKWTDPFFALMILPVYYFSFAIVLAVVSRLVPGFDAEQSQNIGFQSAQGSQLILVFLSLAVIPPIIEEIITRGYLYAGLKKAWPRWLAIIATSVIFAVGHLEFGGGGPLVWVAAIFTLVLSFMLIALREWTGRIWAPIFLHALVNGISFVGLFIANR